MSDDRREEQKSLSRQGQERRDFLRRGALVTAGASVAATAILPTTAAAERVSESKQPQPCTDPKTPMKDVAGKVAFITGGASGIGLGMAQAFVSAGMKVVIADISEDRIKEALERFAAAKQSDQVHAIRVSVTDRTAMEQAAAETVKVFGKVHVLVNNAGVYVPRKLTDTSAKDLAWIMDVNVNGVFHGVQVFLPLIQLHGEGGQIITTSSVLGLFVWGTTDAAYSASKFAVTSMMESLRMELAGTNVGVSVFCPGWVMTNLMTTSRSTYPGDPAQSGIAQDSAKTERAKREFANTGLAIDPLEAGHLVLRGMRSNDLYILSHPEWEQMMRDRYEMQLASLQKVARPNEQRVAKAREMTRGSIYAAGRRPC